MKIKLPLPWGGELVIEKKPTSEDHFDICIVFALIVVFGGMIALSASIF